MLNPEEARHGAFIARLTLGRDAKREVRAEPAKTTLSRSSRSPLF